MPGRIGSPTAAISGKRRSSPLASVPSAWPAPGWTTSPAGLATTTTSSSAWTTGKSTGSGAGGGVGLGLAARPRPRRPRPAGGSWPRAARRPAPPRVDEGGDVGPAPAGESATARSTRSPASEPGTAKFIEPPVKSASPGWRSRITPIVIAQSATLNVGQCGTLMKSTTSPRRKPGERTSRSTRFPTAPPSTRPASRPSRCRRSAGSCGRCTTDHAHRQHGQHRGEPGEEAEGAAGVAGEAELEQRADDLDGPVGQGARPPRSSSAGRATTMTAATASGPTGDRCAARSAVGTRGRPPCQRRRSSRDLHSMHSAAKGSASRRADGDLLAAPLAHAVGRRCPSGAAPGRSPRRPGWPTPRGPGRAPARR